MAQATLQDLSHNWLLRAWPEGELCQLQPQLALIELSLGQVLSAPGMPQTHVYFPTTGIVSLISVMEDGDSVEAAAVGPEGMVGVDAFLGGGAALGSSVVHTAGWGVRMPADALAAAFTRSPAVARVLLSYTQTLLAQMVQTAACTRHHSLDQQLCRWLLLSLDRVRGHEIVMTHERIAQMLGVRREGVTAGALRLQRAGLIQYARGRISVLDRTGIEERSCECYATMTALCRPLMPGVNLHTAEAAPAP